MKKLIFILICLLVSTLTFSRLTFEGTYSFKNEALFGLGLNFEVTNLPIDLGVGVKTAFNFGLYFEPNVGIQLGNQTTLFVKYEPLIAFLPSVIWKNRAALGIGFLLEQFKFFGKIGFEFGENGNFYVSFGASIPFSLPNSKPLEQAGRLQDYGIEPRNLAKIILSTDNLQEIRCGDPNLVAKLRVNNLGILEKILKEKKSFKVYIGFSEDWDIEENGYVELKIESAESTKTNNLISINGSTLKRLPKKVFKTVEQKLYIVGYEINKLITDDFKKPLEFDFADVRLKILPGLEVSLINAKDDTGKEIFSSIIYADKYNTRELLVKDNFGNEFRLIGQFALNLSRAGTNIEVGNFEGKYEDTNQKINVNLKVREIRPNSKKIGEFKAKFSSNTCRVGETLTLNILSFKDIYGNDIGVTVNKITEKNNKEWKFESGRLISYGREFYTYQVGNGRKWVVEVKTAEGEIIEREFESELTVLPNFKEIKISIDEKVKGLELLSQIRANENGRIFLEVDSVEITDGYNNRIKIQSLVFSGKEGKVEIDFSKRLLSYNLTKARWISEKDFSERKIILYIPKIDKQETLDSSELGLLAFSARVIPDIPVKISFDPSVGNIKLPTYYNKDITREYKYKLFDRYNNEASENEIKLVSQSKDLEKVFTTSGGKLTITNKGLTKVGNYQVSIQNLSGYELYKFETKIIPILRDVTLDKLEKVGYNIYKIRLKADDGNGNGCDGKCEITINGTFKKVANFSNGIAEFEFSSGTIGLGSIVANVEPRLEEINYQEEKKTIELNKEFIGLSKFNLNTITYERQINDEKSRENAYGPIVSTTGNYVAYFIVKQDGTPGLVVNNLLNGEREDILSQVSLSRRRSGQSSSELKQQTVYSYSWIPMRDILVYTPMISNSFDIYAYIPSSKQRKELFKNGKNNTDVTFDYLGKTVAWVSGGIIMLAEVDYTDGVSFKNIREVINPNQKVAIQPAISPNGKYIAFILDTDIYLYDIFAKKTIQLTNDVSSEFELSWSPDSNYLVYYKKVGNNYGIYMINLNGLGNGKIPREQQIYKDIAYDFGKPVWISAEEVVFAANDALSSSESISVYDISSGKVRRIRIDQEVGAAYTYLNILPVEINGKYTLKVVYGGFVGREGVFLGQIK
ncbi:MAG: DPP IV N-terminal domain-containing protein [Candidatus Kryptonium sp.]|nr:DPP IV N-terminal domain-containing protein [Candidatus Kryptonium sp.]